VNVYASFNNQLASSDHCPNLDPAPPACLNASMVAPTGVAGPTAMFTCILTAAEAFPVASDFTIAVNAASTPRLDPIVPFPRVVVSAVRPVVP
jgi:hypothetical protein